MMGEHIWADQAYATKLTNDLYHPRSSKHGDFLCVKLLEDLVYSCDRLRDHATSGAIVYELNHTVDPESPLKWAIDLVIGPPNGEQNLIQIGGLPPVGSPREIWMAVDAKSIMTEHGKARRNRLRDMNSLHDLLHRSNQETVVGGLLVINVSQRFFSPLRDGEVTEHKNIHRLVEGSIEMFETLPRAQSDVIGHGLEAMGIIVVNHSNIEGEPCELVSEPPAPPPGDSVYYKNFVNDLCQSYTDRFE